MSRASRRRPNASMNCVSTGAYQTIYFRPVDCPMASSAEARFSTLLTVAKERAAEHYAFELLIE